VRRIAHDCELSAERLTDRQKKRPLKLPWQVSSDSRCLAVMHLITLPQSGSIIDLDGVSFVIRIQNKTGGRGIRIGLGHSELQIITPDDARRFLEELRDSKQVDVENLLKWIQLTSMSIRSPAEPPRPATRQQPELVGT